MSWPNVFTEHSKSHLIAPTFVKGSDFSLFTPTGLSPTSSLSSYIPDHSREFVNTPPKSTPSTVQQLAVLNIALDVCASKLPIMTSTASTVSSPSNNSTPQSRLFAISELFDLTSQFTSLAQSMIDSAPDASQPPSSLPPPQNEAVNEATLLMVVSCHSRLAEIYEKVFAMMQACILHSLAPSKGTEWAVVLPPIEIGSFKAEPVHGTSPFPHSHLPMKADMRTVNSRYTFANDG